MCDAHQLPPPASPLSRPPTHSPTHPLKCPYMQSLTHPHTHALTRIKELKAPPLVRNISLIHVIHTHLILVLHEELAIGDIRCVAVRKGVGEGARHLVKWMRAGGKSMPTSPGQQAPPTLPH